MIMFTPPALRGQLVEVSYGWGDECDGTLYRRQPCEAPGGAR